MYEAWSQMWSEAQKKKNERSAPKLVIASATTPIGTSTTGSHAKNGWRSRKRGSKTVRRNVAYMWGPPMRSVTRRSTPVAPTFQYTCAIGGTTTRSAEAISHRTSQRGPAIHASAVASDVIVRVGLLLISAHRLRLRPPGGPVE